MAMAGKAIRNEPVRQLRDSSVNEVNDRPSTPRKRDSEKSTYARSSVRRACINDILRSDMDKKNKDQEECKNKR